MDYNMYQMTAPSFEVKQRTLRNTYLLLAFSLIPTALGALIGLSSINIALMLNGSLVGALLMIGVIYFLMYMVKANQNSFAGIVWMMAFTFVMGLLLSTLLEFALRIPNGSSLIITAALLTSAIFFVMSAVASVVKRELPFLSNFLLVGSIVLLIAVVANIFLQLPLLYLVICGAFVIFSSLMILWQVNEVVRGGETNYISATLTLYVSLYNLFTSLLQILMIFSGGNRR